MKTFSAKANIAAPAEKIWDILTDAPRYPTWDPNCERIEGIIANGQKLTALTKLAPGRAFPVTVTDFVPNKSMTWTGGMPLGLFKGVRTFTLTPNSDGSTKFVLREDFSGLLLPLIGGSMPDMNGPFKEFVAGLKDRAERPEGGLSPTLRPSPLPD